MGQCPKCGINSTGVSPDASAILDVSSTTAGQLIPRMTTTQRDNIGSPAIGLMIYNLDCNAINYYNGVVWIPVGSGGSVSTPGVITGNATPLENATGETYSITAVTGATGYNWTVPSGATITAGQGTFSITVTLGSTDGDVCVTANNACGTSFASCLAIVLAPNTTVYTFTGSDQTFTVPAGVNSIDVKMWGAGASGYVGGAWFGASGGYVSGTVAVSPGDVIQIVVGAGGDAWDDTGASRSGGYSNGGPLAIWMAGTHFGAGYTGIFTTTVAFANSILIAGGGGITTPLTGGAVSIGGAGGGNIGNGNYSAAASCKTSNSGGGGTQVAGGNHFGAGTASGQLQGGGSQGAPTYTYGGGGGGYYGGGSGDSSNGICGSWGSGGGSSYIGGNATHTVTSGVNTQGTNGNNIGNVDPPNVGDPDYVADVGVGHNSTVHGGDGLVVISW